MKVRCLKDQCCQSNFITDEIANSLNLVTIQDDVVLNVVGFNGPCEYNTRVVELDLDCGDQVRTLNAICIPEIKISLDISNLSDIVKSFVSRGYKLADENLSSSTNKIDNIGFLLGAKSAYCLRATEVTFGLDQSSVYAETNLGIVLLGDGPSIINNAMYLPNLNKPNENVFAVSLNELEINNDFDIGNSIKSRSDIVNEIESNDNFSIFNYNVNDLNEQSNLSKFQNPEGFEISAVDFNENIDRKLLNKATEQMLDLEYKQINYVENCKDDDVTSEQNFKLIQYVLDNTTRDTDGRLVMPLLWRNEVAHLLGKNFQLAKNILISNFNKLKNKPNHLKLMNESFKEQIKSGILSPISNLDSFLIENPNYSFLPHMGVFKLNRETTKCRVVYLSNLCQLDKTKPMTVSHNQAIHSGPCLNSKISIALINLRFDKKLLIFDLQKAFNQILLSDNDSSRLLSLWFKDVENGDYSIVAYRNVRLMFGLRCSPTILMLGLYKLLVQDSVNDCPETRKLKLLIYNNFYMDNGAITASSTDLLIKFYKILDSIFNPYGFLIQQLISNDFAVQQIIDPTCEKLSSETKLLGTLWNCSEDTLFTQPISLDKEANTKRKILASIASQYDLNNFNGPILNRSRLFMHSLQCCKELGWDDPLSKDKLKEWRNIVVQANSSPPIKVPRCIGSRSDEYRLIVFTDTSKVMYGVVIYISNLTLNKISFLMAKNRIVSSKLQNKSIPALELQAVLLGTQCLIELYQDLSGPCCTVPVNISSLELYCDSMVSLSWLDADVNKLAKTQKRTVFVQNRIDEIKRLCEIKPVTFRFISGSENPADYISRCVSYKQLVKTNYMTGPLVETLIDPDKTDTLSVCIPNPKINEVDKVLGFSTQVVLDNVSPLFNFNDVSSFSKIITKYKNVLSFIYKLKARVKERTNLFQDFDSNSDPYIDSVSKLIKVEQQKYFPDIFEFFVSKKPISKTPNLVNQLNVFKDEDGILRVKAKMFRNVRNSKSFPLLLPKNSRLTELIIRDIHFKMNHAGAYSVLRELRKKFYIPRSYSIVKTVLKECIICRRYNRRTIKLNQSSYRPERLQPPSIPFSFLFLDYIGPFEVKTTSNNKSKVWLLCLTCMWSRAINLIICKDYSLKEFLRAFQIHTFQWGLPQYVISDLGSQLVSGSNVISQFLNDPETFHYFKSNNIKPFKFEHYSKGRSELGGMVEVCVKLVKRLIYASIGKLILSLHDFEFLIQQTIHLVNRRPVALREGLRDSSGEEFPEAITPEILTHGYELNSINVIPDLQSSDPDPDWILDSSHSNIVNNYSKLIKARDRLKEIYHGEFISNLIKQSTDRSSRYVPVKHDKLHIGDLVLLKEVNTKPQNYPMGIVKQTIINDIDECTDVIVYKGKTKEYVKRHVSSIIPLLTSNEMDLTPEQISGPNSNQNTSNNGQINTRPQRKAAINAKLKIKQICDN